MTVMETVVIQDVGRTGLPEQKTTDWVAVMTEMYFLQLWSLQGQGQGARVGFRWELFLACRWCYHTDRDPCVSSSSCKDTSPSGTGPHFYDLTEPQ